MAHISEVEQAVKASAGDNQKVPAQPTAQPRGVFIQTSGEDGLTMSLRGVTLLEAYAAIGIIHRKLEKQLEAK